MRDKLPPDFDADWYAATYPDVALSGLNAREHYRRFGKILGRPSKGSARPRPIERVIPEPKARRLDSSTAKPDAAPRRTQQPLEPEPIASSPIIDRPKGFDPAATLPQPAPVKSGGDPSGWFSLDNVTTIDAGEGESHPAITPALQGYARLLNIQGPSGAAEAPAKISCGAKPFQTGPTRIENAWIVDVSRIRLALAGGTEPSAESNLGVVRAYQSYPATPAELRLLGPGITIPALGPVFHDLELLHPLMPVLLELSEHDGASRAFALLPFPSLLAGGVHGAELKALQVEPNPMDAFWALSEAMLQEAIGRDGSSDRSVTSLSIAANATDGGLLLTTPFQEWLAAVFGLVVDLADARAESTSIGTSSEAESRTSESGLQLVLPRASVPTISALVSRRIHQVDREAKSVSYLVADADTYRPLWSIALPADLDFGSAIPLLRPVSVDAALPPLVATAIPLAIALRSRVPLPVSGSVGAFDEVRLTSAKPAALSVLISASDEARVFRLMQTIRGAVGDEVEFIVSVADADSEVRAALDRTCGGEGWKEVPAGADLREIGRDARGEILLTINDQIELGDGRTVLALVDLLQHREDAASVSCALLAETVVKKEVVLQPASGGLFPTGVSFVSGPHLSFGEPDALQAMSDLTYPVVANNLHLTVWRRRALAELSERRRSASTAAEDIRIGLDLTRAGYRNWCTTQITAHLSGSYVPRDVIDPVGAGYLPLDRWQDILSRVTVVRELF
jgi:hypothetical protein